LNRIQLTWRLDFTFLTTLLVAKIVQCLVDECGAMVEWLLKESKIYIAKLTVVQPVKKSRTFYGYRRFGTEFVRARQWFVDSNKFSSHLVIFRLLLSGGFVVP